MAGRNRKSFRISKGSESTYTRADFRAEFPDDAACLEHIKNQRWPNGILCKSCGTVTKHYRVQSRPSYSCEFCGHHVHPLAGTIYHKSSTSLVLWFEAIYLMHSTRCGISAKQLERELGVTYKTAWRMFTQIRKLMKEDVDPMSGGVEVDESFFGGKNSNRHLSKRTGHQAHYQGKTTVFGMVDRTRKQVCATVVPTPVRSADLLPHILRKVTPKGLIFSDEARFYEPLEMLGFQHQRVHHQANVYVSGEAHVNTLEGFWSLVKRGISGVHHVVGSGYLQSYLDEYAWRYNHREDEQPMFVTLVDLSASPVAPTSLVASGMPSA